jgi:hypothetical protein
MIRSSMCVRCFGLVVLFCALRGSALTAQTTTPQPPLETLLTPGMTAWVTASGGRETKVRILGVSDGVVTAAEGEETRRLRADAITRVRVRRSDTVIEGALIGAGAAVASGLVLCTLTEPWRNCRDDIGPMTRIGAVGAGIGIAVDALIRGRTTIYTAPGSSTRLHAVPLVGSGTAGVLLSVKF